VTPVDTAAWTSWRSALVDRVASGSPLESAAVRQKAALVLIDDLAAMVAGAHEPEIRALAAARAPAGRDGEATVVAGGRADRERAAGVNAAAAAWNEMDEGYRPATCHGGLYTLPAAMAECEAAGATVGELLESVVIGYEFVTAVARLLPAPRPLVLHPHATLSPIGAAAAVAWFRTRDPRRVLEAVDVAATMSMAGPFRHASSGLQARNAWAAAGAMTGFFAVDCAAAGLASDAGAVLDVFQHAYGHAVAEAELTKAPGHWAILDGYHKSYAACQYTHAAIEATAEIAPAVAGRLDEVREVLVETHQLAIPLSDPAPVTALGGKFSVPHVVAAVLASGSTDAGVFGGARLADPAVAALRQRVVIAPFEPERPAPHDRPARVSVRLADGYRLSATCLSAVGGPDRPLAPADVLAKAALLTAGTRPAFAAASRRLADGADGLDQRWADVLADLLRSDD
jgi:2-methylcitrate dehydratase PrpD